MTVLGLSALFIFISVFLLFVSHMSFEMDYHKVICNLDYSLCGWKTGCIYKGRVIQLSAIARA